MKIEQAKVSRKYPKTEAPGVKCAAQINGVVYFKHAHGEMVVHENGMPKLIV